MLAILPKALGVIFWEAKAPGGRMSPEQRALRLIVQEYSRRGSPVFHVLGGASALTTALIAVGLVKPDQVPHYRLAEGGSIVAEECPPHLDAFENPAAVQAHFEVIGRQARAKRRQAVNRG